MIYLYDVTRIDDLKEHFLESKRIDITRILSYDFTNLSEIEDICEEIRAEAVKYSDDIVVVLNRQDAIKRAAEETDAEWIILIAGKGIENSIKRKEGWVPMEPDNKCIERVFCEIESRKG